MSKSAPTALPDLDDAEFAAKLQPLANRVIPQSGRSNIRISERPVKSASKNEGQRSRLSVAEHMESIEHQRGPKRRFEYLIPVRVGEALAHISHK